MYTYPELGTIQWGYFVVYEGYTASLLLGRTVSENE